MALIYAEKAKDALKNVFNGNIEIVNEIENWQGTGIQFEYYRRILD